jgi:tRNA(Ser,Leu) C12 N-acetylase TAN1
MKNWNMVICIYSGGLREAFAVLGRYGKLEKTEFFNVLGMMADDSEGMLDALARMALEDPNRLAFLSRLIPVTISFSFQSPEEFEAKAREAALRWVPALEGKGFYVRMHRRGFKGKLSSQDEERFLDEILLKTIEEAGTPGHITFEDPDAVIAVETIANWAGLSLITKQDLDRYPFIRPDS